MRSSIREHHAPVGYVIECRGAWLRAQIFGVATCVTVAGRVDEANLDTVVTALCRFTILKSAVVIDLRPCHDDGDGTVERLISEFGASSACRGSQWALVADPAILCRVASPRDGQQVIHAESVAQALDHFLHAHRRQSDRSGFPRPRLLPSHTDIGTGQSAATMGTVC
jgi:hypothetical protein